ncbi:hypothetical protein AK812_SmicGene35416 [Symbiodinium microadriaticum]|uniref:Uncharacterized protein n=1 Tax=Symbiodinium microadriaticum TaxID=2951 RepID=A0A1Q9CLH1_SYMMI|nr:hypothetical protein AK812_SmicGene35416 [Symbiodinium microadriaticum]
MYFEYGFPAAEQLTRLCGASPQSLGLKPVEARTEEGKMTSGYIISLDGITFGEYVSMRKLRVFHELQVAWQKLYVEPERQLTAAQGQEWYEHATKTLVSARQTGFKVSGRGGLKSLPEMKVTAQEMQAGFSDEEPHGPPAEGITPEGSEKADLEALQDYLEDAPSTVQHGVGFAAFAEDEEGAEAKKSKAKKRKQPAVEEAVASDDDMGLAADGGESLLELGQTDVEMADVARKHHQLTSKNPTCFSNLQVLRILQGEKLGKAVQGAKSCLKTLVNNKVKEQHALHDRIARCEAAMQLMGEPLRAIPQPEFLKLMIVLRDDITAAPVPLQTAVTGKLIQDQLQEAVKTTDRKEALKLVEKIAARMLFPVSEPSFAPLLEQAMKQASKASDVTDLDFDLFGEEPTSGDGKEEKKGDRGLESNVQEQSLLLTFFKSFLSGLQNNPGWDELLGFPSLQPVRDAVQNFKRFVSCVHELVQADHEVRSFESLQYFLKYKGTSPWERTICNILTKPERNDAPDSAKEARAHLLDLAEDAVKTSASTLKFEPTFLLCMEKLQAELPSVPDLKFTAEHVSAFKEGLRKGRAQSMEKMLVQKLSAVAASVFRKTTAEDISSEDVDSLLALLKNYSQHSACFDASNQLTLWANKHNCRLHQEALSRVLETYLKKMGEPSEKVSLFEIMPLDNIKALARKARPANESKIPEPLRGRLLEATVHLLQLSVQEANAHLDETIRGAPHSANVARAFAVLAGHASAKAVAAMFEFVTAVSNYRLAERLYAARGKDAEQRSKNDAEHASFFAALGGLGKVRETLACLETALGPQSQLPDIDVSDLAAVRSSPEQAAQCVNFKHFVAGERSILSSEVLSDAVSFVAAGKNNDMRAAVASLDMEAKGFASAKSWKESLPGDADLAQVLETYEKVLKPKVQSAGLKTKLEELLQVVSASQDFADQVSTSSCDLMKENDELRVLGEGCTEAAKLLRSCGAIFTEIVLSVSLKSIQERASDLQAVQKAKGLISGQVSPLRTGSSKYGAVKEDIHPLLYEQAVAAMQ